MTSRPSHNPRLSLVVLVRNDAVDLRRLLSWHRDLYDEAVVVDTGSRDDSVAVAHEMGARVSLFTWVDDFSAARNRGLAQARGDWVLVLDCDELIAASDFSQVRRLCQGEPTGWFFDQWNYCGPQDDPRWSPVPPACALAPADAAGYISNFTCRLFPRRPAIVYEGIVHELPDPALRRCGVPFAQAPIVIHHTGHLPTGTKNEQKKRRYASMLRLKLQQNPRDTKARFEMAVQLVAEGLPELAQRLLERTIGEDPQHPQTYQARLLLGSLLLDGGAAEAAVAHLETAVRKWPALREGWVAAARAHTRRGEYSRAAQFITRGRSLFPADRVLMELEARLDLPVVEICEAVG